MPGTTAEQSKAIVLEAFDTLFNKRDYAAAECFWSPDYIEHSAHIGPGRSGLFDLVRSLPDTARYMITSLLTGASPAPAGPPLGSPPTSSASRTASSPNTGMCSRTKPLRQSG